MDRRALAEAWRAKYEREPAPWRPGLDAPVERLSLPARARVLEVGAGGGKTTSAARAAGFSVVPIDFVRGSLPAGGLVAEAEALPFRDGAFDGALLVHVLGHLDAEGRARAAREAERVVRPGGGILVVAFGEEDVRARTGSPAESGSRMRAGILTHCFTANELRGLLPGAVVDERRVETRWGTRHLLVASRPARGSL